MPVQNQRRKPCAKVHLQLSRVPVCPQKSVRLVVNYLRTQKAVVRVSPEVPLQSILPLICAKCDVSPEHVVLLRDNVAGEELQLSKSLNELGIKELYAWDNKRGESLPAGARAGSAAPSAPCSTAAAGNRCVTLRAAGVASTPQLAWAEASQACSGALTVIPSFTPSPERARYPFSWELLGEKSRKGKKRSRDPPKGTPQGPPRSHILLHYFSGAQSETWLIIQTVAKIY